MLGTPGVEASAPCPIPGSGSWASYRTPPTPGPPTLLITGHRPGHGEKPAGAVILGRDRWRKGAQQRKRTGWGMRDISERADRVGGGAGGGGSTSSGTQPQPTSIPKSRNSLGRPKPSCSTHPQALHPTKPFMGPQASHGPQTDLNQPTNSPR